ncbi:MAG TPA: trans-splicing intein-formed DNA polymerase III subunit alpha C-terminal partner DnaE-C [Cyanobacteria bacterium UBA11162]|nr:trans-splicing intein-formed DNA polymerase III subunit alpha C-terminal partner DnaE-C [Cyanobacteria bacterium UBA11162]
MVKIISRKFLGTQSVYDIGVERDHNFLLQNGLVASNCFNKSHSTAYAYVTYQTAFLKANYKVEYMTALLTASSDSQEKVQKYIATCSSLSIEILQPDINRSDIDFTPEGNSILFGLSAIRNLGEAAIECILKARETGGEFKSLADFCDRVDLRTVNRRAIESLINSGAFDRILPNRKQLIADLDLVISWAQDRAKDRESGQLSIFGNSGTQNGSQNNTDNAWESAPKAPSEDDYSHEEKLQKEKELLGFYVSDHPLKSAQQLIKVLSPINLNELAEQSKRSIISAMVMLNEVKVHVTKTTGERMAFVQMEDMTSKVEGIVFAKTYKRLESLLQKDAHLIIWGKIEERDEKTQIIIEDAEPIETVQMVIVDLADLKPQQINTSELSRLESILKERSGDKNYAKVPVLATISTPYQNQFVRFNSKYWVQDATATVSALKAAGFSARAKAIAEG